MFLGRFDSATYTAIEIPIARGAWCLMYTDGVPETTNQVEQEFGDERFRTFLCERDWANADELANGLLDEVSRWSGRSSGADPEDDVTLVAIRITQ